MLSKNLLFAFFFLACFITTLAKTNEAEILQQTEQTVVPIVFLPPAPIANTKCFGPGANPQTCVFNAQPVPIPAGYLARGPDVPGIKAPVGSVLEPNPPAGQCFCSCRQPAPLPPVQLSTTGPKTTAGLTTGFTTGFSTTGVPPVVPVSPPVTRTSGAVTTRSRTSGAVTTRSKTSGSLTTRSKTTARTSGTLTTASATTGGMVPPSSITGILSSAPAPPVTPVTPVTPASPVRNPFKKTKTKTKVTPSKVTPTKTSKKTRTSKKKATTRR